VKLELLKLLKLLITNKVSIYHILRIKIYNKNAKYNSIIY